jgi:tetratricopeptide (TPR) repeat protein
MDRAVLEKLSRDELIAKAEAARIGRASMMTRSELVDELLRKQSGKGGDALALARGFFGIARDLLSRVVEKGLHLPDATERLRNAAVPPKPQAVSSAIPTVTLAEIYAAQGYYGKAIETLKQVMAADPENADARALLARLGQVADAERPYEEELEPEGAGEDDDEAPSKADSTATVSAATPTPQSPLMPSISIPFLNDQPLPAAYDVDECVALPVDERTLYVYWEVRSATLEPLQTSYPGGTLCLRVAVVVPTWEGPQSHTYDIQVHAKLGDYTLRNIQESAVVRVGIFYVCGEQSFAIEQAPLLALAPAEVQRRSAKSADAKPASVAEAYQHQSSTGESPIVEAELKQSVEKAERRMRVAAAEAFQGSSGQNVKSP